MRAAVSALAHALGERAAMNRLALGRLTLARLIAGLPVRAGTLALVRERLAALKREEGAAPKP
jgi:ABC-type thiamin/hydroxymethylpyrimidine transport system permease subunit